MALNLAACVYVLVFQSGKGMKTNRNFGIYQKFFERGSALGSKGSLLREQIFWPPSSAVHASFDDAIEEAVSEQIPLVIAVNTVVHLTERIHHKLNSKILRIIGCSDGDKVSRPLIISSAHSVFETGGKGSSLIIENLRLHHTCFREHHKDIGGVIYGRDKSKIQATNCELLSDYGFGVWAVQKATVELNSCRVRSATRSGCVSFGKSSLSMNDCTVHNCHVHGVWFKIFYFY
jgi:hypothetical protein